MKIYKNLSIKLPILAILLIFGLSTCSEWQGGMAKVVISFNGAGRVAGDSGDFDDPGIIAQLEHLIVFSIQERKINFQHKGGGNFESFIEPGNYTIWVYSSLKGELCLAGTEDNFNIRAGQDNVIPIKMYEAYLVKFDSNGGSAVPDQVVFKGECAVKPSDPKKEGCSLEGWYTEKNPGEDAEPYEFKITLDASIILYAKWETLIPVNGYTGLNNLSDKLAWLHAKAEKGKHYLITVKGKESIINIFEYTNLQNFDYNSFNLTITGGGTITLSSGQCINIGGSDNNTSYNVKLTLDNITLKGDSTNKHPIINVVNGELVMNNGAIITGNTNSSGDNTGGVYVQRGGTFTMNGGEIFGNTGVLGGGVNVNGGTFIMNNGKISGNKAKSGGGVYVSGGRGGTFIMNGGVISGNTAESSGGGVYVFASDTDGKGTFTKNGGTIYGYTAGDNNSNKVITGGKVQNNKGSAVYRPSYTSSTGGAPIPEKRRETTAGPSVFLRLAQGDFGGQWDK